jgi:glycosyltransferase involved in cell wall biosynthesis
MFNKDFSIIIPAYNNLHLLKNALSSVANQKDIIPEIIIVDDSTDDNIERYVKSLPNVQIHYHHNNPALGAVGNWNYGLSLATGKCCLVLHHDEKLTDNLHLKKCLDRLSENYDVVVSNIKVHTSGHIKEGLCPDFLKKIILRFPVNLVALNVVGPCACIAFKKEKLQYFDENLCWLVDSEWYYRIINQQRVCYLNNLYVSSLHGHQGQISSQINIDEKEKQDRQVIRNKYRNNIRFRFVFGLRYIIGFLKQLK